MRTHVQYCLRPAYKDEIIDLRWKILRAGLPRESAHFDRDDDPTTRHFAAVSGDAVVACATFLRQPIDHSPAWQLRGMAVSAIFRGTGLGKKILEFAEKLVLDEGYSNVLWCNARVPAAGFYQRLGWQVVSEEFEIPTAGPHVKMIKRL